MLPKRQVYLTCIGHKIFSKMDPQEATNRLYEAKMRSKHWYYCLNRSSEVVTKSTIDNGNKKSEKGA
jgi:hypothetical protein